MPKNLPDRVTQLYYAHGLFCASHSGVIIALTSIIILLCSYPLTNLPLPGNVPQIFSTHPSQVNVTTPRWFYGPPKLYVQQIIMKSTVGPWNDHLLLMDAFRGPLAESFKLAEIIHNYQHNNSSFSLDKVCLNVESVKKKHNIMSNVLPEYNCLLLSPSNLWNQDFNKFQLDSNLINTIYNYQNFVKGKISISEMLFGIPLQDAGVKRYPLRKKQRVIQFAVTVFMTQYHASYINGLRNYLNKLYPLSDSLNAISNNNTYSYIHVYYPEDVNYGELIPLSATYVILFLYVYFCVWKMELIKSKVGMALSAVLTVLATLCMTIGICFFFGLEFTGGKQREKQVFPYLVIIVGLENVLVLIKSIVSTTPHLDVKIRIAQGLSKEGWNITKNLLIEVTILTAGLLTFVPMIQEFCIFAIVGLLSDFFLQMVFFSTILSLNIECIEQSAFPHYAYYSLNIPHSSKGLEESRKLPRSRSHPRLMAQNVIAPVRNHKLQPSERVAKRIRMVHFWARTRFVQRSFMIGMVLWISIILYNADTIQNFIRSSNNEFQADDMFVPMNNRYKNLNYPLVLKAKQRASIMDLETKLLATEEEAKQITLNQNLLIVDNQTDNFSWLKKVDYDTRRRLSVHHWQAIVSLYNISFTGSYITLLPTINIVQVVSPEIAQSLRNPEEKGIQFRWQSLAVALDPLDFPDVECTMRNIVNIEGEGRIHPFIPSSPMEIFMASLLCITSVFVVAYTFVVLYRCICTRNYAEWRASWANASDQSAHSRTQVVMEALYVAIEGHTHLIECLATDGNVIASSCLGGHVKIWDAISGEMILHIERSMSEYKSDINTMKSIQNFRNSQTNNQLPAFKDVSYYFGVHNYSERSQQNYKCDLDIASNKHYSSDYLQSGSVDSHYVRQRKPGIISCPNSSDNLYSSIERNTIFCEKHNDRTNVPIWCIDCKDNVVVLGCVDGCLEFYDCTSGELKCTFIEEDKISITSVKLLGGVVLAAKLNGTLCFYKLDMLMPYGVRDPAKRFSKYRRSHLRTNSVDSMYWQSTSSEQLHCLKIESVKAHTKSITVLEAEGEKIITGSEDRMLKVFEVKNQSLKYTLHGHYGPITCVFIDRFNPTMAGSGSQDGLLCVWDLHTGSCMYSIQAHDGMIFAITYSASYVISLGQDERICVWDRFQGHLLNTISMVDSFCTSISMLTHNLLVTSKQGCLIVLDVGTGETVRLVKLGPSQNLCIFIKHILNVGDGVVCDYGDELRLVRFPLVYDKND